MNVLITGGSGLIGTHFANMLRGRGYDVALLSRTKSKGTEFPIYTWDTDKNEIELEAIEWCDYIIHLAGVNIGDKRWSKKRKLLIINSRVKSIQLLFEKIMKLKPNIKAFITSSAIGYYGTMPADKIFNETDPAGNDFLAETCRLWEDAADQFKDAGIRTVKIRTGIVLSMVGGAFKKMLLPVKLGLGSPLGSGKQAISWIHVEDLCSIYLKAIEDIKMEGAYNAVTPDYKTNQELTKTLARVLHKPFWFPRVPSFLLKLIFGEMSAIILKGNPVSANKITTAGFKFMFPDLESALKNLLLNTKP